MIEWMLGPAGMFNIKTYRLEDDPYQDILRWLEFDDLGEVVAPLGRNATTTPKPELTQAQRTMIEQQECSALRRFY